MKACVKHIMVILLWIAMADTIPCMAQQGVDIQFKNPLEVFFKQRPRSARLLSRIKRRLKRKYVPTIHHRKFKIMNHTIKLIPLALEQAEQEISNLSVQSQSDDVDTAQMAKRSLMHIQDHLQKISAKITKSNIEELQPFLSRITSIEKMIISHLKPNSHESITRSN